MADSTARTRDLNWSYNGVKNLDSVNLEITSGSFTGIIGPNGAGKTTLLKLLLNLLQPERKTVFIDGKDIRSYGRKELAGIEAYVPQTQVTGFEFTVEEMVLMGRYPLLGRFESESAKDRNAALQAMTDTGIIHLRNKAVTKISGGELQRAVIARALAQEPNILFLDEPTSHLDIHHQLNILSLLKTLCIEKKITVVSVLHNMNHAMEYCDSLFLLHNGRIAARGAPAEVISPEKIREIYGINISVIRNPFTGHPHIIHEYAR